MAEEKQPWIPGEGFVSGVDRRAREIEATISGEPIKDEGRPSRGAGIRRQIKSLPRDVSKVFKAELTSLSTSELERRLAEHINTAFEDFKRTHPRFAEKLDGFISGEVPLPKKFPAWLRREAKEERETREEKPGVKRRIKEKARKVKEAHERFKEATPDWVYQGEWGKAAINYWKFGRTVAPLLGGPAALLAVGAWTAESGVRLGKTVLSEYGTFSEHKKEFLLGFGTGTGVMIVSQFIGFAAGRIVPGGEGAVRLVSYGARRLAVPYINQLVLAQIVGHISEREAGKRMMKRFDYREKDFKESKATAAKTWLNAGMITATIGTIGLGTFVKPVLGNIVAQIKEAGPPASVETPTATPEPTHTPGLGIRETVTPAPTETPIPLSPTPTETPTPEPTPTPPVKPWEIGEIPDGGQIQQAEELGVGDIDFDGTPDGRWLDIDHDNLADALVAEDGRVIAWAQEFDLDGDGDLDRAYVVDFNDDGKADALYAPEDLGLGPEARLGVGHASPIRGERAEPPMPRVVDVNGDGQFTAVDLQRQGDHWSADIDGNGARNYLAEVKLHFNQADGRWEIDSVTDGAGRVYTFDAAHGWTLAEAPPAEEGGGRELTEDERLDSQWGRLILGPKGGVWGLVQQELYNRHPDWTGDQIATEAYRVVPMIEDQLPEDIPMDKGAPLVYSSEDNLGTFLENRGVGINLSQLFGGR